MEISHGDMTRGSACRNPIVQDRRGATLRELRHSRMPLDYGALPRTWEDPLIAGAGRPGRQVSPAEALAAAEALATSAAVDDASPMTRAEFDVLVDADPLMGLPGDGDPLDVMLLPTGGRAAVEEGSG
jgi:inorganic pyrophosphatase